MTWIRHWYNAVHQNNGHPYDAALGRFHRIKIGGTRSLSSYTVGDHNYAFQNFITVRRSSELHTESQEYLKSFTTSFVVWKLLIYCTGAIIWETCFSVSRIQEEFHELLLSQLFWWVLAYVFQSVGSLPYLKRLLQPKNSVRIMCMIT